MRFIGFIAFLVIVGVTVVSAYVVHDRTVGCHTRIRKTDACWTNLNEQVKILRIQMRRMEQSK